MKYYHGYEISKTGLQNNRVDMRALGNVVGGILNNRIVESTIRYGMDEWEMVNGSLYECDEDGTENERYIYQYFIITDRGADILMAETDEIVLYNEELDMYIWGVTCFGTPWEGELTNIPIPEQAA